MCTPSIDAMKEVGWLVPTVFNVFLVVAGWLVLRRRNRVDKLRETWANWTASAWEAVEAQSALIERDAEISRGLQVDESKIGPGVAASCDPLKAELIKPERLGATEAVRRLLRDLHTLELLENDDRVLATANSLTNPLVTLRASEKTLNTIRIKIAQLALANRQRFLHRFGRKNAQVDMPEPFRDSQIESLSKTDWQSPVPRGEKKQP